MKSFTRDMLFPATGAIGLIVSMAVDPAVAQDAQATSERPAVFAAATVPVASAITGPIGTATATREASGEDAVAAAGAGATKRSVSRIEGRCGRTERIGKFTITRCD
jgi:hypothetical protein